MAKILHLVRSLTAEPVAAPPAGWRLRHYAGLHDVDPWLALRAAAFAVGSIPVRPWTPADFERELLAKSWWRPEALWFAERVDRDPPLPIGTAILARRGAPPADMPVMHWLAVLPEYRRRGVGRLLVAQLESLAWQDGYRQVALETHAGLTEAVVFYRALGYDVPCRH